MESGRFEVCAARKQPSPLLEEGSTCWRVTRAARDALLIDVAAYFDVLSRALPLAPITRGHHSRPPKSFRDNDNFSK